MTAPAPLPAAAPAVPVTPDSDEARGWLLRELAEAEYQQARPNPVQQFLADLWQGIQEFLGSLGGLDPAVGPLVLVACAAVVVILLAWLSRPRLNAGATTVKPVFGPGAALSADAHRRLAEAAAARQDWTAAVTGLFRALVRDGEERVLLDERPGRTADEAARQLGSVFPERAEDLHRSAGLFDGIRYGGAPADETDYEWLAALDAGLRKLRPAAAPGTSAPGLAAPQ